MANERIQSDTFKELTGTVKEDPVQARWDGRLKKVGAEVGT